jgi:hypothetical protein
MVQSVRGVGAVMYSLKIELPDGYKILDGSSNYQQTIVKIALTFFVNPELSHVGVDICFIVCTVI